MEIVETLRRRKLRFYRSLKIALAVSLLAFFATQFGLYETYESKAIDIFFNLQPIVSQFLGVPPVHPSSEIVIVDIDDKAFAKLGKRAPLPRWYLASLIDVIIKAGAKVIVYDIDLTVATDPKDDALLLEAIQRATGDKAIRIVFSYFVSQRSEDQHAPNNPETIFGPNISTWTGFANIRSDPDEVVRDLLLARSNRQGRVRPSLALAAVASYSDYDPVKFDEALNRGDTIYLDLKHWDRKPNRMRPGLTTFVFRVDDQWKIDFSPDSKLFLRMKSDHLKDFSFPSQNNIFRDKIVLIGGTFEESRDFYAAPKGDGLNGVEIHATAIDTILSRSQIRSVHPAVFFIILLGFALVTGVALTLLSPGTIAKLTTVFIPILFIGCYLSLQFWKLWIDLLTPVVAMGWGAAFAEFLRERSVTRSLAEFVNQEVANQIIEEEQIPSRRMEATVFFTDIRDFTTISEEWSPTKIVTIMNDFFAMIGEVIRKHNGCIIDFVGDGLFAVFGVVIRDPNHAASAVAAAREIQDRMHTLNIRWQTKGLPALRIGIGIHTGVVVVDVVGSAERKKFSVTGDSVNVGSRVEGLNKEFSTSILITEDTRRCLNDGVALERRGKKQLKGRREPVEVFEVLDIDRQWRFTE
jgi:class 3 adenylate cyclase/CHASE2 domain-containing sensor protein